jgi:hypothetical protein
MSENRSNRRETLKCYRKLFVLSDKKVFLPARNLAVMKAIYMYLKIKAILLISLPYHKYSQINVYGRTVQIWPKPPHYLGF